MKNAFLSCILFFCLLQAFGQQSNTAYGASGAEILSGKEKGIIELKFPENITKEDIEKYAVYYKNTFQTNFDVNSHKATFTLIENNSSNRRVILRFLAANQIQYIVVDGMSFIPSDFYEKFLK
jgi:hypothetical protein